MLNALSEYTDISIDPHTVVDGPLLLLLMLNISPFCVFDNLWSRCNGNPKRACLRG